MLKAPYMQLQYERDKQYIQKHDSAGNSPTTMSKLEILMRSNGKKDIYMNHSGLPSKILSMEKAYRMLETPPILNDMILGRREISSDELRQVREECFGIIRRRVDEMFDSRYRGALQRTKRYEREQAKTRGKEPDLLEGKLVQKRLF